jgi:hypothetical protein
VVAAALTMTPSTTAAPGSGSEPLVASFAPVWPAGVTADADELPDAEEPAPAAALSTLRARSEGPIAETGAAPLPTGRPAVRQPAVAAGVTIKAPPPPKAVPTSHAISGKASWYCRAGVSICMAAHPDRAGVADMYAAAGPGLRRAICGSESSNCWRGRTVMVNGVAVVLADWCGCSSSASSIKLIDLYWDAWTRVPGVESGVTIRW